MPHRPLRTALGHLDRAIRRRATVRLRLAVAAGALVALSALALGLVLTLVVNQALERDADAVASQRALDITGVLQSSGPSAVGAFLAIGRGETTIAQVIDASGTVVASSPQIAGENPLVDQSGVAGPTLHRRVETLPVGDGTAYRIVVSEVALNGSGFRVVVAQSLRTAQASVRTMIAVLSVGLPFLALIAGSITSFVAGRSLRPVEAMRREVAEVSASDLDRRVQVPRAHDEVSRLASTMNQMLARIQDAHDAQRRFVADASHELRSPLTTVRVHLQLAGLEPDPREWPQTHTTLISEVDRIDRIVSNLLLLASADASGLVVHREDVDLDDLIDDERRRVQAGPGRVALAVDVSALRVRGDAHYLAQMLRNLIDNALTHAVTLVEVRLFEEGDEAVIEVSDDGPGIPVGDRDRVFDRLVRLDTARARSVGGSGLGLAIAREVANAHGGSITVGEGANGGARFTVRLPLPDSV